MIDITDIKLQLLSTFSERFGEDHASRVIEFWHDTLQHESRPPLVFEDLTADNIAELVIFMSVAQTGNEAQSIEAAMTDLMFPMISIFANLIDGTHALGKIDGVAEMEIQPDYFTVKVFSPQFKCYINNYVIGNKESRNNPVVLDSEFLMKVIKAFK